ncbi:MAG: hypothetical protein HQ515_08580, partial [Phycisphaeraceae bacterium]|nr:hypothetical protein [Phycisphaeraceae bacterium]
MMCRKQLSLALFGLMVGLFLAPAGMADLIGYWPLDGNASDLSGNAYDGAAQG